MSYSIKKTTATSIYLSKNLQRNTSLFKGLCVLFAVVGLLLSLHLISEKEYASLIASVFMATTGLIGIYIINASIKNYDLLPEKIEFDNLQHAVKVYLTKESLKPGYIPYTFIASIEIKKKVTGTKKKQTVYNIHLLKKDSGIWELSSFDSENNALTFKNTLQTFMQSAAAPTSLPDAALPERFNKQKSAEGIGFQWLNSSGVNGVFMVAVFTLLFGAAEIYLIRMNAYFSFTFFIFTFLFLILIFCLYINIRSILEYKSTYYSVLINSRSFIYREIDIHSGRLKKETVHNIADLSSLAYNFKMDSARDSVFILNTIDAQQKLQKTKAKLTISNFINYYKSMSALQITSLNAVEAIELERWIQETIRKESSKEIL